MSAARDRRSATPVARLQGMHATPSRQSPFASQSRHRTGTKRDANETRVDVARTGEGRLDLVEGRRTTGHEVAGRTQYAAYPVHHVSPFSRWTWLALERRRRDGRAPLLGSGRPELWPFRLSDEGHIVGSAQRGYDRWLQNAEWSARLDAKPGVEIGGGQAHGSIPHRHALASRIREDSSGAGPVSWAPSGWP